MSVRSLKSNFYLLNVDYVKLNKSWNYKNIISPFYRIYLIDEGEGLLSNPADSVALEPGFLYLVPSFTLCNYSCQDRLGQYYVQFIEESPDGTSLFSSNRRILKVPLRQGDLGVMRRLLDLNPDRGLSRHNPRDYEKRPILRQFEELNNLLTLSAYVETNGIILQFLSRFLGYDTFRSDAQPAIPSTVLEAIHYIQTNLQLNLTVTGLANRAGQHVDYFSRIFLEYTGERPLSYIQFKRIEHAQFLMITADLSFDEIAAQCGFESLSYFSRVFKKIIGQTPGHYRRHTRTV